MDVFAAIEKRKSGRSYSGEKIPDELLERVLKAGELAPSSRNKKPVKLIPVRDRETLQRLSRAKKSGSAMLAQADCGVLVCADKSLSDVWVEDASVAMSFMMLEATELGLANCWVQCRLRESGEKDEAGQELSTEDYVRKVLGIEEKFGVLAMLSLGM